MDALAIARSFSMAARRVSMKGMVVVVGVVWVDGFWLCVGVWVWEEQGVREEEDEVRGSAEVEGRGVVCSHCGAPKRVGAVSREDID